MNITKLTSIKTICNSYLIEEDGFVVIIDPGQDGVVEAEIDSKGYQPEYILLTHEHFDHVQDLEEVRGKYGIPVISSRTCRSEDKPVHYRRYSFILQNRCGLRRKIAAFRMPGSGNHI